MAWPDFTKALQTDSARTILGAIQTICTDYITHHAPSPIRTQYVNIRAAANSCVLNQGHVTHSANPNTDRHSLKINTLVGDPNFGNANAGFTLDQPYNGVTNCFNVVSLPNPSSGDLAMALDNIDHIGGNIPPPGPNGNGGTGHRRATHTKWPAFTPSGESVSAADFLGAILARARGPLCREDLDLAERALLERLASEAFLDQSNLAHGGLRSYVTAAGTGVTATSLKEAWTNVKDAYNVLHTVVIKKPALVKATALLCHPVKKAKVAKVPKKKKK